MAMGLVKGIPQGGDSPAGCLINPGSGSNGYASTQLQIPWRMPRVHTIISPLASSTKGPATDVR